MTFWKWSGQDHLSSNWYCCHNSLLWKYILDVLFCYVYNNTTGFKIVETVIWTIFVATDGGPDRQLSQILILLLKSKLFVTNQLRFFNLQTVNIVYIWQIQADLGKSIILKFSHSLPPRLVKWPREAIHPKIFAVDISICYEYVCELKTVCFDKLISLQVVPNQSIIEHEQFYNFLAVVSYPQQP